MFIKYPDVIVGDASRPAFSDSTFCKLRAGKPRPYKSGQKFYSKLTRKISHTLYYDRKV